MARKSVDWKYNIGDNIKSSTRNMTIIDRETKEHYYKYKDGKRLSYYQNYKYHCNICGFNGWISLSNLKKGVKCSCCSNRTVVKGINDIATLRPDLIKYFVDINDAYSHTIMSSKKIKCVCPICGTEKYIIISNLNQHGFSCDKCSDGISYPEKFLANVLSQLNIEFIKQYKINDYKYKYDFYLPKYNTIIEVHGEQHYDNVFLKTTLEEVQQNDFIKKNVALQNNIDNYVELNCSKSTMDYIKNSIYNNEFFKINFNIDNIDWELCHKESLKNKLIEICEYWNDNFNETCVSDVMEIFSMPRTTVLKYLHIGTEIGLCNYDRLLESKKSGKKRSGDKNGFSKKVKQFTKKNEFIKEWDCIADAAREFNGYGCNITKCCKGEISHAYGFVWKYVDD